MRVFVVIAACLLLVAPSPAPAAELLLGGELAVSHSDNVLGTDEDKRDDISYRVTPWATISGNSSGLAGSFTYRPSFIGYLDTEDIDGWQHEFRVVGSWQISERTSLRVTDSFQKLLSRQRFNDLVFLEGGETFTEVEFDVSEYETNSFTATLTHLLNQGHSLVGSLSHGFTNFDVGSDNSGFSLAGSYRYQMSPRSVLSFGPSFSRQEAKESGGAGDQTTDFYGVNSSLTYVLGHGTSLSLSAGPSWISSDQSTERATAFIGPRFPELLGSDGRRLLIVADSCPRLSDGALFFSGSCQTVNATLIPGFSNAEVIAVQPGAPSTAETRLTFFAGMSISKQWKNVSTSLSYRRSEAPSSGIGASNIVDSLTAGGSWRASDRLTLSGSLGFSLRSQATESLRRVLLVLPCPAPPSLECGSIAQGRAYSDEFRFDQLDSDSRIEQIIASFSWTYRLRERIALEGSAFYLDQSQRGDQFVVDSDQSRFSASFLIRWDLDPIPF